MSSLSFSDGNMFAASDEGQLAIDVFRDDQSLVIRSTVAGVRPDQLEIAVHGDLLTIRGKREDLQTEKKHEWYYRECYWGAFSRSIVLPFDVDGDRAAASLKNGVLEVRIPIREHGKRVNVQFEE